MKKKLTEKEMLKEIKKHPEIMKVWGALRDVVPELLKGEKHESPSHS